VFERFTERARRVVVLAQEEAGTLGHDYIGTEHLLLGLAREQEGLASRVLASLGVSVESARERVVAIVGSSEESTGPRQVPFTPRAKKVLQLSLREALSLGHNYIGTEHLLLGLVRENEGVATRILLDLGAGAESIRVEVTRTLSQSSAALRPMREQDRSWLDFTPGEAFELVMHLAKLSSRITFEVRRHGEQEPTFRLSARLLGNDTDLRELVALEAIGIRAVLDRDATVRLGHLDWSPPGGDDAGEDDAAGADG
jgi:ATP-dependent Clp protease ATP-binding subunit ClpA